MQTQSVSEVRTGDFFPVVELTDPGSFLLPGVNNSVPDNMVQEDPGAGVNQRRPCALVVDDVEDVTEMLSVFLYHAGYEVITADSATRAIAAAQARHFDVVVSDIGMPEMNGYQLAEELRKLPGYSTVPMIAVTGFSMYDDQQRSLRSGFNAHLTKPIDPVNLFELIEQLRG